MNDGVMLGLADGVTCDCTFNQTRFDRYNSDCAECVPVGTMLVLFSSDVTLGAYSGPKFVWFFVKHSSM
jgi:hypothetical protein